MKKKENMITIKKISNLILVLLLLLSNIVSIFSINVVASGLPMDITSLSVSPGSIDYGRDFTVDGQFGGDGYTVTPGQHLHIPISTNGVQVTLPSRTEKIYQEGVHIADVVFSNQSIDITFTEEASQLENVKGRFTVMGQGHNTNTSESNIGTITFGQGKHYEKDVDVVYTHSETGVETDNVYSKQGISYAADPKHATWVFTLNAAKKSSGGSAFYVINDTLNDTMNWDIEKNKAEMYAVNVEYADGHSTWLTLEQAATQGINVNFKNDKEIEINANGNILEGTKVVINLKASLTQEVLDDLDVKFVENSSSVKIHGVNESEWPISEDDLHAQAIVYHSGASGEGTIRGSLSIVKYEKGSTKPIPNVTFKIERIDGREINISSSLSNNDQFVLSDDKKSIEAKTDNDGKINIKGLSPTKYKVTEVEAPSYVKFDKDNALSSEFIVDENNTVINKVFENEVKSTDVSVEKIWVGGDEKNRPNVYFQLMNEGEKIGQPKQLESSKVVWKDLPEYENGKKVNYTVEEVNEDGTPWEAKGYTRGKVEGSIEQGFKVINKYDSQPGSIVLSAKKSLSGRDLVDGEFKFELRDEAGKVLQTQTNQAGQVNFD
ncbi:SpaA isopeptide-forming pilin-related protein, partial [Vagococcus martis]